MTFVIDFDVALPEDPANQRLGYVRFPVSAKRHGNAFRRVPRLATSDIGPVWITDAEIGDLPDVFARGVYNIHPFRDLRDHGLIRVKRACAKACAG